MSHIETGQDEADAAGVVRFLQALARHAKADPQLAATLAACLRESGLATPGVAGPVGGQATASPRARGARKAGVVEGREAALDPFTVWRAGGEAGLRLALAALPLPDLRTIVRAYRLDPARVSSRWTAPERVAALIVDQVKARMRHGRAFERV